MPLTITRDDLYNDTALYQIRRTKCPSEKIKQAYDVLLVGTSTDDESICRLKFIMETCIKLPENEKLRVAIYNEDFEEVTHKFDKLSVAASSTELIYVYMTSDFKKDMEAKHNANESLSMTLKDPKKLYTIVPIIEDSQFQFPVGFNHLSSFSLDQLLSKFYKKKLCDIREEELTAERVREYSNSFIVRMKKQISSVVPKRIEKEESIVNEVNMWLKDNACNDAESRPPAEATPNTPNYNINVYYQEGDNNRINING